MNRAYDSLRSGAWLTAERIRLVAVAILCVSAASIVYDLLAAASVRVANLDVVAG